MDPAFQWRPTIATLSRLEHLVNVTFSWCWGVELDAEWPAFLQALDRFYNHLRRNGQRERKEVKLVVRLMECPVGHRKYPTLLQDECHEQWDNADGAERGWKLRFSDWQASNIYCNANREEDLALRKKLSVYQNMQCITPSAR
ncbi:hypothetical protein C1H76_2717 [Elsinoe australis]|uniref:Uncharacterized protein n=1 Tax=Elsinoe australis TaxID=40998 RepID=A0A4U7B659_9PEZI|nr:hypothetical protein C1H76_2717 [Elsinoe australis]